MAHQLTKKKGFRAVIFSTSEHWNEDPPGTYTSTSEDAKVLFEFGKDDGQAHGKDDDGCGAMKPGSKVVITEGGPGEDDRATVTREL